MLHLTSGTAFASSSSYDVLQLQQGSINNSPSQLQALLGNLQCSPVDSDFSGLLSSLQNNGTMLQLLPEASSTDIMPLVLQMPGTADQGMHMLPGGTTLGAGMQLLDTSLTTNLQTLQPGCMPQGYLQAPGQQMLQVDMTSQLAACAGTGDSNAIQMQMQQLRAAVQQLNSQTAAVQQLLLRTQPGAPQGSVPVAVASNMATNAGDSLMLAQPSMLNPSGQQGMPQCVLIPSGQHPMLIPSGQQYTADPSGRFVSYVPGQPHVIDLSGQQLLPPVLNSSNLPDSCAQASSSGTMDVSRSRSSASSLSTSSTFSLGKSNVPSPSASNSSGSNQQLPSVGSPAAAAAASPAAAATASTTGIRTCGQLQILSAPAMPQPSKGPLSCALQGPAAAGGMGLGRNGSAGNTFGGRPLAAHRSRVTAPGPSSRTMTCGNSSMRMAAGVPASQAPYSPAGTQGAAGSRSPAAPMGGPRGGPRAPTPASASAAAGPNYNYLGKYASVPLMSGLQQLWSRNQLHAAPGGTMFNVQQLAWQPVSNPTVVGQDMYDFSKLKRVVQKLDAVHKHRVKLIKRIHGVAEYGQCDLKLVYQEVRSMIGEVLRESAMYTKSIEGSGVGGLVRLALLLQEALLQGRK